MAGMEKEYDVIVIGGGVSGLSCGAYLQKLGLKVAIFERREEAGTHCTTEELMGPGVKMNLHASFIGTHHSGAALDLDLENFGYEAVTSSEWGHFHPFQDGTAFCAHISDARETYRAWQKLSPKDAEFFRRLTNHLGADRWSELLDLARSVEGTPENEMKAIEIVAGIPGMPPDAGDMNGFQLADILFEDERIKAAVLSRGIEIGIDPWIRGVGAFGPIIGILACNSAWSARGGSHALPHAVARCFVHYGGSLFQGCPVAKIDIQNGEAKGIFLSKNAIYPEAYVKASKAVVSNLSARPTFLELIGRDKLPLWATIGAASYDYHSMILFTNYWALKEAPEWAAAKRFPEITRAYGFNFGADNTADLVRLQNDCMLDRLPDPPIGVGGCIQGYAWADPSQAPPGQLTLMTWCVVPYDIRPLGGPEKWDEIREEYGDKVEDLLKAYMPNLKRAKISRYCMTPYDIYRRNPSAWKGCFSAGAITREQAWHNRPFPGCGAPRSPIAKLYLSNSIWPVGGAELGGGKVPAEVIARDLGIPKPEWWRHKAMECYPDWCKRYGFTYHPTVD